MRVLERLVMLQIIDRLWVEHLTAMENMRLQAGWAAMKQMKSVDAYKSTGYQQFQTLLDTIQHDVAHTIYHVALVTREPAKEVQSPVVKAGIGSKGNAKPRAAAAGRKDRPQRPLPLRQR